MTNLYAREISIPLMLKAIKINFKVLFIFFIFIFSFILSIYYVATNLKHKQYTNTGSVRINNFVPNSYVDQQITTDADKQNTTPNNVATRSEVEEALIKSGYTLIPVIKKNHLDIHLTPKVSPVLDIWIRLFCNGKNSNNTASYCKRNNASPEISRFDVAVDNLNTDYRLMVTAADSYELYKGRNLVLSGKEGVYVKNHDVGLLVDHINVGVGTKFDLRKVSIDREINELSDKINVEPIYVGKNFVPAVTGVLKISMTGEKPVLQAQIINDIMNQMKMLALDQQSTVLRSSIDFVESQINTITEQLAASQKGMVIFQSSNNVISLDNQEREYVQQLATVEQSILENKIAINQFSLLYASKHPMMLDLYTQRDFLAVKKAKIDSDLRKLPKNEAEYLNLKRNLDVYQQLYSFLLNKEQDLKMKLAGLSSPVEILYYASSDISPEQKALSPKILIGLLVASLIALLLVFFSIVFKDNSDPWLMPKLSDISLLTVVPFSRKKNIISSQVVDLITSYLLSIESPSPKIINIGSISSESGKTSISQEVIKHLTFLGKKCLYIKFGIGKEFKMISETLNLLEANKQLISRGINQTSKLYLNTISGLDREKVAQLFSILVEFDFVILESPAAQEHPLYLNLAWSSTRSIIIITPKDTRNKIEWFMNDYTNLNIKIDQIIYNNPHKTLLKSLFAVESYNI